MFWTPLLVAFLFLIYLLGFTRFSNNLKKWQGKDHFTEEFFNNFEQFIKDKGQNQDVYDWMIYNTNKMELSLGSSGILTQYRDPIRGIAINNLPIIKNMIPEIYQNFTDPYGVVEPFNVNTVRNCLIRFRGTINQVIETINQSRRNPILCIRLGLQLMLGLPISFLHFSGLLTEEKKENYISSKLNKLIASIILLAGFLSTLVTIVNGADNFIEIISNLL